MHKSQLGDLFVGVGVKRLSRVDVSGISNQHEVGITRRMSEQVLGTGEKQQFQVAYIWLGREQEGISEYGSATYYDTRANNPRRHAEWRLYYTTNPVVEKMQEGDSLFLVRTRQGQLLFIVTPPASPTERQLCWLFGIDSIGAEFFSQNLENEGAELDFAARYILDEIGVEFEDPDANSLDSIVEKFGTDFPTTRTLSDLARQTLPEIIANDNPDMALVAWLSHEEALFRRIERNVVSGRLKEGFLDGSVADVDAFISFSLSVQNRRKSRMGHSLENHLEAIFIALGIRFVRGAVTENLHKPDFLFPDSQTYLAAPPSGSPEIRMLAAKSSCKDRWRQVLTEAAKIEEKHLLTLEPSISVNQTDQMKDARLQLVVPSPVQKTYTAAQKQWLWSLADLITELRTVQRIANPDPLATPRS